MMSTMLGCRNLEGVPGAGSDNVIGPLSRKNLTFQNRQTDREGERGVLTTGAMLESITQVNTPPLMPLKIEILALVFYQRNLLCSSIEILRDARTAQDS